MEIGDRLGFHKQVFTLPDRVNVSSNLSPHILKRTAGEITLGLGLDLASKMVAIDRIPFAHFSLQF